MGIMSTKMGDEVTALKAEIVTIERRQAYVVATAVKQAEDRVTIECKMAVQEEKARADQLEEQKSVAELQNELLTEMVAAEQVKVKLQERRNQALKWELLRQGGTQEKFNHIAKEVPDLGETLGADTAEALHGVDKHSMSEAIEHVVYGLREVDNDLHQAFLARDKMRTGTLGTTDFKDALRECLPDIPRADRCLLALRFVREGDQSIDYSEFLEFCRRKAQVRKRLKLGLTGALAITRSAGLRGASSSGVARALATTMPSKGTPGLNSSFATAPTLSRSEGPSATIKGSFRQAGVGHRRSTGRMGFLSQEEMEDSRSAILAERKITEIITRRGKDLELLFKKADPAGTGVITVKAFSECLRSLHVTGGVEGNTQKGKLPLTRSDRKVLYRKWTVHGQVRYYEFLQAGTFTSSPSSRQLQAVTSHRPPLPARRHTLPSLPRNVDADRTDKSRSSRLQGHMTSKRNYEALRARNRQEEADDEPLTTRTEFVLTHLSEVLEEKGEKKFFAAFEARDAIDCRELGEDDFIDAIAMFAPEVTTEQALDVFWARSCGVDRGIDYDELFKELRTLQGDFQSGDEVQFGAEDGEGRAYWVYAQVVSRDSDGTYTVRFNSRVPGRGYVEECGVIKHRLRVGSYKTTPHQKGKKRRVVRFLTRAASWWTGLSEYLANAKVTRAVPVSTQLMRLLSGNGNRASASAAFDKARRFRNTKEKLQHSTESGSDGKITFESRRDERPSPASLPPSPRRHHRSHRWADGRDESYEQSLDFSKRESRRLSRRRRSAATASSEASSNVFSSSSSDFSNSSSGAEQQTGGIERHHKKLEYDASKGLLLAHPSSAISCGEKWSGRDGGDSSSDSGSDIGNGNGGGWGYEETGKRCVTNIPVIQEASSPPQGKLQPSHDYHRRRTSPSVPHRRVPEDAVDRFTGAGLNRKGRGETLTDKSDQHRDGGLKSLGALEHANIENKFDLYKKRAKAALSPEKSRLGATSSTNNINKTHRRSG